MTVDDTIIIALRELGYSEDAINQGRKLCDLNHANLLPDGARQVPKHREREFVDKLKIVYSLPQKDLLNAYAALRQIWMDEDAKN